MTYKKINSITSKDSVLVKDSETVSVDSSAGKVTTSNCKIDSISNSITSRMDGIKVENSNILNDINAREKISIANSQAGSIKSSMNGVDITNSTISNVQTRDNINISKSNIQNIESLMGAIKISKSTALNLTSREKISILDNSIVNDVKSTMSSLLMDSSIANDLLIKEDCEVKKSKFRNIRSISGSIILTESDGNKIDAREDVNIKTCIISEVKSAMGSVFIDNSLVDEIDNVINVITAREKLELDNVIISEFASCGENSKIVNTKIKTLIMALDDDLNYVLELQSSKIDKLIIQNEKINKMKGAIPKINLKIISHDSTYELECIGCKLR